jgi:hypothetical protein
MAGSSPHADLERNGDIAAYQSHRTSAGLPCHLHADARIDLSLPPIGDGLMLARKR